MSRRTWNEVRAARLADPEAQEAYESAARALRLGEEVRRIRLERGLSQEALAQRIGVPQSVIARLEAGGVETRLRRRA